MNPEHTDVLKQGSSKHGRDVRLFVQLQAKMETDSISPVSTMCPSNQSIPTREWLSLLVFALLSPFFPSFFSLFYGLVGPTFFFFLCWSGCELNRFLLICDL